MVSSQGRPVKAYLEESSQTVETRRFQLDPCHEQNYDYLKTQVASIFPTLKQKEFFIFWKGWWTLNYHCSASLLQHRHLILVSPYWNIF